MGIALSVFSLVRVFGAVLAIVWLLLSIVLGALGILFIAGSSSLGVSMLVVYTVLQCGTHLILWQYLVGGRE